MSRPSSTAPPGRAAKARWASSSAVANARHRRDDRGRLAHFAAAQHDLVEIGEAEAPRRRDRGGFVVKVAVRADQRRRGRAVEEPRVEMRQAVARGEAAGDGALADAAGPSMAMIIARAQSPEVGRPPGIGS